MPSREEVRERIKARYCSQCEHDCYCEKTGDCEVPNNYLKWLHSVGVMIKTKDEPVIKSKVIPRGVAVNIQCDACRVEPLIEGEK